MAPIDVKPRYPGRLPRAINPLHVFLTALGFRRTEGFTSEFAAGVNATRAGWRLETAGGATFGIEVRQSRPAVRDVTHVENYGSRNLQALERPEPARS